MKNSFIVFAFFAVLTAAAQRGWQLGFEAGPGYYTMLNEMDKNADPKIIAYNNPELFSTPHAWAAGAKFLYGFADNFSLQTGLRYTWGKQDYTAGMGKTHNGYDNQTISTELNYLQLPLMLAASVESNSGSRFYASVGFAPAWLFAYYENQTLDKQSSDTRIFFVVTNTVKERSTYNYRLYDGVESIEERTNSNKPDRLYKTFNLFFNAEAGFLVPLQNGWQFNIAVNYSQSLFNPDNVESDLWEVDKYTRNEMPYDSAQIEEPTKYDRPKTTLMTIGISLGLLYELDW